MILVYIRSNLMPSFIAFAIVRGSTVFMFDQLILTPVCTGTPEVFFV